MMIEMTSACESSLRYILDAIQPFGINHVDFEKCNKSSTDSRTEASVRHQSDWPQSVHFLVWSLLIQRRGAFDLVHLAALFRAPVTSQRDNSADQSNLTMKTETI